uniref:NADH-ubiquinone oxidoreductase chain 2 n=1 Tax=Corythoxestis sunosei TaxID=2816377 RepID=A0A899IL49_9NEOP|nr:NADH dehydrogenase subunit 2 [Corythoxestis sunosei]QSL98897.1 NADH dehydrogenase subunit 2 [Corythoxestis sunosei]
MMNFNSNKMFFLFILFSSTLISISSNSWIGCWIGLEVNLLSFIPLMMNHNNIYSSEASLKYFLTQSIASINLLFLILLKMSLLKNIEFNNFPSILMNSSILMKMGSAPFHFWFPNIIEGLTWFNSFILMTWQKITPLILLSYSFNFKFLVIIMILNAFIGAIGGLNQTSMRKLLAYSSINNLSWMIMSILISENLWMIYFIIYSILNMFLCYNFYILNLNYYFQIFFSNMKIMLKLSLMLNFLSLGGLPPLLGFLPKWLLINFLMNNNLLILNFIFIMMSLILLYFYIRIIFSSFMFNHFKSKWMNLNFKNFNFFYIMNMIFFSLLGLPLSTLIFYY